MVVRQVAMDRAQGMEVSVTRALPAPQEPRRRYPELPPSLPFLQPPLIQPQPKATRGAQLGPATCFYLIYNITPSSLGIPCLIHKTKASVLALLLTLPLPSLPDRPHPLPFLLHPPYTAGLLRPRARQHPPFCASLAQKGAWGSSLLSLRVVVVLRRTSVEGILWHPVLSLKHTHIC